MNSIVLKLAIALSFCYFASSAVSQELELSKIMAGDDFIGHQPESAVWKHDSKGFYFEWNKSDEFQTYFECSLGGSPKQLETEDIHKHDIDGYFSSNDGTIKVFQKGASLFRLDKSGNKQVFKHFRPYQINEVRANGDIIVQIESNLFKIDGTSNTFTQLTNFIEGSKVSENFSENYLEHQQKELFQIQKKRSKQKELRQQFNEASKYPEQEPIYLDGWILDWISISPDNTTIIYELTKYPKNENTNYASFVNESGYTEANSARPKVGSEDPEHLLYFVNLDNNEHKLIETEKLSGVFQEPEFLKRYNDNTVKALEQPKAVIYHGHGFSENGLNFLIEIKSYDNKDRWICTLNETGELNELDHQHDQAWIGGPGISSWNMVPGTVGWISNDLCFYQSEKTGYSHLYSYNIKSKSATQLTDGKYEIHEAFLNQAKTDFFISANKSHPGNRDFLLLNINTKAITPILTSDGNHKVSVSPDEKSLLIRYSTKNKPWELYTAKLEPNAKMKQVTFSTSDEFNKYDWRSPEVITFKATDNTDVNARIYEPKEGTKNNAAVIFVHGAGYLQNAHNWWSGYHREYMFNNLLADKGYTILDIDYRASKGYGRDFRTGIYRYMGGKDLSDNMDGRQYLINTHDIDPERIGMYGGSYGGFITLMALLTEPGKLKCGAALRSVTDWAHYNHQYTSNILNTPDEDPEAYRASSPIYYAQNLEDKLLMLHGMEDDNVQYQDVVRLSQRFIELEKKNWDLIGYPIEKHGFKETSSWINEYHRILALFEEELVKH